MQCCCVQHDSRDGPEEESMRKRQTQGSWELGRLVSLMEKPQYLEAQCAYYTDRIIAHS